MKNFAIRTLSGIVFVIVVIGAILFDISTFALLYGTITALAVWEFCTLVNNRREIRTNRLVSTAAGLYLFIAMFLYCGTGASAWVFVPYLITLMYLLVNELYIRSPHALDNWVFSFAAQLYVALPFALINVLAVNHVADDNVTEYSPVLPLALMIFLWANDMGAYCVGSLLHRYIPYKLFPSVSPHKSWIGSIGGALLTVGAGAVYAQYNTQMTVWQWMLMAAVVVVFGTLGDLVESMLKRSLGVKDSGRFLPGHGGVLDRFDSSMLAIPAVIVFFYLMKTL